MRRFSIITFALLATVFTAAEAAAQNTAAETARATARAAATAGQKRAIEALAEKYADHEGFSFAGSLDIENIDISNILKDISSIIVVRSPRPDSVFTREVSQAVSHGYSTVLSSTDGEDRVRFLLSENGGGEGGRKEFVIFITGRSTNLVVSIVGDYTLGRVTTPE